MIEHSSCFQHDLFLDCTQKVRNTEVYYRAISFYLEQQPLSLGRLLQVTLCSLLAEPAHFCCSVTHVLLIKIINDWHSGFFKTP